MNCCMEHRGGVGYETNAGDGAGIVAGMPHDFLNATAKDLFGVSCPDPASTGLVIYFYPPIPPSAHNARALSSRPSKIQVKRLSVGTNCQPMQFSPTWVRLPGPPCLRSSSCLSARARSAVWKTSLLSASCTPFASTMPICRADESIEQSHFSTCFVDQRHYL